MISPHNFRNDRVIMKLFISALLAQTAVAFVPLSARRPQLSELRMAADGVLNKYSRYDMPGCYFDVETSEPHSFFYGQYLD